MKKIDARKRIFVYVLLLLFFFSNISYAQLLNFDLPDRTGIKITKNAMLHGAFKTAETLDTNIYLNNTDRKVDSITVISPSGGIEIPSHNSIVSADYQADIFLYGVNHTEDHVDQTLRGLAEISFADYYKFTVKDVFRIFTSRAANENSLRLKQEINDVRGGISAEFNRLALDAGYTNRLEMYDSTDPFLGRMPYDFKNRDVNIIDTTVSYRFWPKTSAFLENDIGFINYYNTSQVPGSYYDEVFIGFKGEWFAKANVNFKAGFKYQDYDQSTIMADKAYIGPVMKGGFDYSPTPDDIVLFEFDREIYESTYSNMNYYTANLIGFTWQHHFTKKLYSSVFASYQLHLYPSESRENGELAKRYDNYYQAGANLKYDIRKWVSVEAKYAYVNRDCRFDIYSYVDHQMTVCGTVGF
ncbi:MAG: outer membrane beta-barrel protein [Candidatus Omnitrophica bacterium]|nr:outer membrane beta-barrel protein [Candidatus Omnitrophota bacterium]